MSNVEIGKGDSEKDVKMTDVNPTADGSSKNDEAAVRSKGPPRKKKENGGRANENPNNVRTSPKEKKTDPPHADASASVIKVTLANTRDPEGGADNRKVTAVGLDCYNLLRHFDADENTIRSWFKRAGMGNVTYANSSICVHTRDLRIMTRHLDDRGDTVIGFYNTHSTDQMAPEDTEKIFHSSSSLKYDRSPSLSLSPFSFSRISRHSFYVFVSRSGL